MLFVRIVNADFKTQGNDDLIYILLLSSLANRIPFIHAKKKHHSRNTNANKVFCLRQQSCIHIHRSHCDFQFVNYCIWFTFAIRIRSVCIACTETANISIIQRQCNCLKHESKTEFCILSVFFLLFLFFFLFYKRRESTVSRKAKKKACNKTLCHKVVIAEYGHGTYTCNYNYYIEFRAVDIDFSLHFLASSSSSQSHILFVPLAIYSDWWFSFSFAIHFHSYLDIFHARFLWMNPFQMRR